MKKDKNKEALQKYSVKDMLEMMRRENGVPQTLYPPYEPYPPPPPYPGTSQSDKHKYGNPYSDYYKHMYYPGYHLPPKNSYPEDRNLAYPPPYPSSKPLNSQSQAGAYNPPNSSYPSAYGSSSSYPYFSSYPPNIPPHPSYGMYPPYYYNHEPSPYHNQQYSHHGLPPRYPPHLPHLIDQQVKEEIVISSDQEGPQGNRDKAIMKGYKMFQKHNVKEENAKIENIKTTHTEEINNKKINKEAIKTTPAQEYSNPFEIKHNKHKSIYKKDVTPTRRRTQKPKETPLGMNHSQGIVQMDKEEVLKLQQEKIDKLNIMQEKEGVKAGIESKGYGESKYASNQDPYKTDEKENMKREKAKDDHPLKELRYRESHGSIRIGGYFQSVIPQLLKDQDVTVMKKRLQMRLQQRQVAAITF